MTSTMMHAPLACLLLIAVLLSAGCTGQQPGGGQVPGPDFRGETFNYDDRTVFHFIPNTDEAAVYSVTYTIEQDVSWGTTIDSGENVIYENISRSNPIEIIAPREDPSNGAAIEIEIRSMTGEVLHRSRTSVQPEHPPRHCREPRGEGVPALIPSCNLPSFDREHLPPAAPGRV